MRRNYRFSISSLLGLCLAACGQTSLPVQVPEVLKGELVSNDPVTTYSYVARGLNKCWLADQKPLQKSQLFARATANKNVKKEEAVAIFIHGSAKSPKRGPRIFSILFSPDGSGTRLHLDNRLLDPLHEAQIKQDLKSWSSGKLECSPQAGGGNIITPQQLAEKEALLEKQKRGADKATPKNKK